MYFVDWVLIFTYTKKVSYLSKYQISPKIANCNQFQFFSVYVFFDSTNSSNLKFAQKFRTFGSFSLDFSSYFRMNLFKSRMHLFVYIESHMRFYSSFTTMSKMSKDAPRLQREKVEVFGRISLHDTFPLDIKKTKTERQKLISDGWKFRHSLNQQR